MSETLYCVAKIIIRIMYLLSLCCKIYAVKKMSFHVSWLLFPESVSLAATFCTVANPQGVRYPPPGELNFSEL